MEKELIPIKSRDFFKIAKGCGIKYRNKIPDKELKAMLGYCPTQSKIKVEISDDFGFCQEYLSMYQAAKDCGLPSVSSVKYALGNGKKQNGKNKIKRRSDQKVFYLREIK